MTTTTTTKSTKAVDKKQELIERLFEQNNKGVLNAPNCLTCQGF